jgi:23S rRNA-/tRNA-specific pseudouridylate synthase
MKQNKQKREKEESVKIEYVVRASDSCSSLPATTVRTVKPYVQDFRTFTKGRWLGRELLEVVNREFGGHPFSYWRNAIAQGHVRINNQKSAAEYKFQNGDTLSHKTHR